VKRAVENDHRWVVEFLLLNRNEWGFDEALVHAMCNRAPKVRKFLEQRRRRLAAAPPPKRRKK
jgi:hypothetical protein